MKRPGHDSINGLRVYVLLVVRCVALVLILAGFVQLMMRLMLTVQPLVFGGGAPGWFTWVTAFVKFGGLLMLVGALLAAGSVRVTRWLVRPAGVGCAVCGHEGLDGEGRCVECGAR